MTNDIVDLDDTSDLDFPTITVDKEPSIQWDHLEVHLVQFLPESPIWQIYVHELINDLLDDEPRWSTRMMFAAEVKFSEHWFNAGGLRDGLGGAARLPA